MQISISLPPAVLAALMAKKPQYLSRSAYLKGILNEAAKRASKPRK